MEVNYKEELVRKVKENLLNYSLEEREYIISNLIIALKNYEVNSKKYEIVEFAAEKNKKIIQKFYVSKKIEGLSERTLKTYLYEINYFNKYLPKDLTTITTDDIRYYLAIIVKDGKNSNVSLDNKRRILNTFFQWLLEEDFIQKNPVIKIKKVKSEKLVKSPFSDLEIEKLRSVCNTEFEKALFEVLISSGARRLEIQTALRNNYCSDKGEILILGKGKKERKLFISTKAVVELNNYLATRKDDNPYLFVSSKIKLKEPLSETTLAKTVKKLGERAGINGVHLHRFRRTLATSILKKGMPIEQVQKLLGHSELETTLVYAKVNDEDLKNNFRKLMF